MIEKIAHIPSDTTFTALQEMRVQRKINLEQIWDFIKRAPPEFFYQTDTNGNDFAKTVASSNDGEHFNFSHKQLLFIFEKSDFNTCNSNCLNLALILCTSNKTQKLKMSHQELLNIFSKTKFNSTAHINHLAYKIVQNNKEQELNLHTDVILEILKECDLKNNAGYGANLAFFIASNNKSQQLNFNNEKLMEIFSKSEFVNTNNFRIGLAVAISRGVIHKEIDITPLQFQNLIQKSNFLPVEKQAYYMAHLLSTLAEIPYSSKELVNDFHIIKNKKIIYNLLGNIHDGIILPNGEGARHINKVKERFGLLFEKVYLDYQLPVVDTHPSAGPKFL